MGNSETKNFKIIKRKYYAIELTLSSPLCLFSGQNEITDADVLVNSDGEPFIPGTSLAGAMRDYLDLQKDKFGIFGYFNKNLENANNKDDIENGCMSCVYVSDIYLNQGICNISERDGIRLKEEEKVVEDTGKFDWQIVETGAKGILYLNYIVRENQNEEEFEDSIRQVFQAIQSGAIRLGSKKNRGFGRLRFDVIYQKEFRFNGLDRTIQGNDGTIISLSDWIYFKRDSKELKNYPKGQKFEEWEEEQKQIDDEKYIRLYVPLKLNGGISIRRYSAKPNEADYEQITCNRVDPADKQEPVDADAADNQVPVIPGTSWGGAIRADVREILNSMKIDKNRINKIINDWFGFVSINDSRKGTQGTHEDNPNNVARQSKIIIGESVLDDATKLSITRNKINRFDGAPIESALYTEKAYFGGHTVLEIMVKKEAGNKIPYALIGALYFAIKDIQEGFLAVGGLTSVGRGVFSSGEDSYVPNKNNLSPIDGHIFCSENISIEECKGKLYEQLYQEGEAK